MSETFYTVDEDRIKDIADAIRLKRDITDEMTLADMPMQIGLIGGEMLSSFIDEIHEEEQVIDVNITYTITDFAFEHNSGFVPDVLIAQVVEYNKANNNPLYNLILFKDSDVYVYKVVKDGVVTNYARSTATGFTRPIDENVWGYKPYNNTSGRIYLGTKFKILALKFKEY